MVNPSVSEQPKASASEDGERGLTNSSTSVTEMIRDDIIKGVWAPRQKLGVKEVADRYGVGVIPVREALARLSTSGFVDFEDRRGFWVTAISLSALMDVTETRVFIETEALRRSILAGDIAWEETLLSTHHRMRRTPIYLEDKITLNSAWEIAHTAYHTALISGCQSNWLIKLAMTLREQTERYRNLSFTQTSEETGKTVAIKRNIGGEHADLLNAVLNKEVELACNLLASHIRQTSALSAERLRGNPHITAKSC
ncbi:MAG: bacterial regulatory protein GntR family protein 35 [Polaromonas sp.]|nr:bacterial regulatory protein GntR family protein 35 [Polaromonas sp.]